MKTPNATTRFTQERGITLVEILVALVVIAFVLLGIAQVFPGSARGQVRDRMMRGATYLAQEKLEYLNTLSWGDAALIGGRHPTTGAETCGDNNAWTRYWQVTTLGQLTQGRAVNIEIDTLARYLARMRDAYKN